MIFNEIKYNLYLLVLKQVMGLTEQVRKKCLWTSKKKKERSKFIVCSRQKKAEEQITDPCRIWTLDCSNCTQSCFKDTIRTEAKRERSVPVVILRIRELFEFNSVFGLAAETPKQLLHKQSQKHYYFFEAVVTDLQTDVLMKVNGLISFVSKKDADEKHTVWG